MTYTIKTAQNEWEIVCGLEIHCQIISKSKIFSGASTAFGDDANENVSFIDAGMPGMLPVLNKECVRQAVKTGFHRSLLARSRCGERAAFADGGLP